MYDLPLVSIVIPVYNGSNYLREAIDSALSQTYTNIEVLVINDGSKDEGKSEAIALSFGNKIRYFFKKNGGVASALNMGIREMKGEYFSWLSHDDVYYPHKISSQIEFLKSVPLNSILYTDFDVINEKSEITSCETVQTITSQLFRYYLTISHPVHGCTTLIPRDCFDICGYFDENLWTTQDYDYWFRLAGKYCFLHVKAPLIQSRHHIEQGTVVHSPIHVKECNELLIKFLCQLKPEEITGSTGKSLSLSYARMAKNFVTRKFYFAARKAMLKSLHCFMKQDFFDCLHTAYILIILVIRPFTSVLFKKR